MRRIDTSSVAARTRRLVGLLCLLCAFSPLRALSAPEIGRAIPDKPKAASSPEAREQTAPTPAAAPEQAIPLTNISGEIDALDQSLQKVRQQLATDFKLPEIDRDLRTSGEELGERGRQTEDVINSLPSLAELQDLEQQWRALSAGYGATRETLVRLAAEAGEDIASLKEQRSRWEATLGQVESDQALQELAGRVRQSFTDIQNTLTLAEGQLELTVTLQNRLAQQDRFVTEVLEKIDRAQGRLQSGLLERDSRPLWDTATRRQTDRYLERGLRKYYTRDLVRLREFVDAKRRALLAALLAGLVALVVALNIRRSVPKWAEAGIVDRARAHVLERPYSLALLAGLLATFPLLPAAPSIAKGLISLLFVIPVLRLAVASGGRVYRRPLYALLLFVLAAQLCKFLPGGTFIKRDLLALLALAAACAFAWLARRSRSLLRAGRARSLLTAAAVVGAVLMCASFIANLVGYFALSQILSDGTLLGAYYAFVLFIAQDVIYAVCSTLLNTGRASALASVRGRQKTITQWLRVLLDLAAGAVWVSATLNIFTVRDTVFGAVIDALKAPIKVGAASFTLGDVLSFVLIFVLGVVAANVVRVVLQEDVLKRLPLKHGVPYALSTLTYYMMLLAIFLLAVVGAGVELSRFTVLTGAFGVGVGFGLQNIVNNFASGLILLFERPVRVHDMVEVDDALGEVLRIGMRSTSLRTRQGSEVIVPNSSLVADKVVNWSRLGGRRRAELPVKAALGADPRRVIELLVGAAVGHPSVVHDPAPVAFFKGYAEAALDFTLVYWVTHYKIYPGVSSEVALRVADAFDEAGVSIAFPQQYLHVKSVDDSIRAILGAGLSPRPEQPPDGAPGSSSDLAPKSNNRDRTRARPGAAAPGADPDEAGR